MSIFVLNIATMLGLALAIDYSLFIVSRFREELRPRPDRRRGRRAGCRHGRQGRRVQRHRGRDRPVGPAAVRGAGHPLDRHRGCARRPVLGPLRPDLPAGGARHARPPRQRPVASAACASRIRPVVGAWRPARSSRWERVAHAVMRRPDRGPRPDARGPAHRRHPVPAPRAGRAGRGDLPGRRREPRCVRRAADGVRPGRDDADRRSSPTCQGSPTDAANDRGPDRLRGAARRDRRHRPGRGTVRHPRPGRPARSLTPDQVAALYALPDGPAAARPRRPARPLRPRLDGPARCDQPALAVRARRPPT